MLNKKNQTIVKTVSYILLIIIAIYCVFPFIWMVISAFKPKDEIRTAIPSFVIHAPTLENFKKVLFQAGFINYIKNSFNRICNCLWTFYGNCCNGRICIKSLL